MNVVNLMNVTSRKIFQWGEKIEIKKKYYERCDYCEYTEYIESNFGTLTLKNIWALIVMNVVNLRNVTSRKIFQWGHKIEI